MPRRYPARSRVSDQEIARAVAAGATVAQALRHLGLCASGANYKFLHHAVARLLLDTSHWRSRSDWPPDPQFAAAVAESTSAAQVLRRFGLACTGGNYRLVRRTIARLALDTRHWLGQAHLRGRSHNWAERFPLSEILVENSTYGCTSRLKQRLRAYPSR